MSVDVIIEDPRWEGCLPELAERASVATLLYVELVPEAWEIAILGCNDLQIAKLNTEFRGKPVATNVLSWPSAERGADIDGQQPQKPIGDPELGDIAIAYETCLKEAQDGERSLSDHASHLLVHGILHLLGYDHERDGDGDLMEATEIAILAKLGVANPYSG